MSQKSSLPQPAESVSRVLTADTSREGDWVQVENPNWKGWINSQFLAPDKPQ
jgi:hypothetical protein